MKNKVEKMIVYVLLISKVPLRENVQRPRDSTK